MGAGTATEISMCGTVLRLGDYVRVQYATGERMRGAIISGTITELWSPEHNNHLQARVSSGWCFHDCDEILKHKPVSVTEFGEGAK